MSCKQCLYSECRSSPPGYWPILMCSKHETEANEPCEHFTYEPGTDEEESETVQDMLGKLRPG